MVAREDKSAHLGDKNKSGAMLLAVLGAVLAAQPVAAEASTHGLIAQQRIVAMCAGMSASENCLVRASGGLHRGRVGQVSGVVIGESSALQTRSGVLLKAKANERISEVIEDSPLNTSINLDGDVCSMWTSEYDPELAPDRSNDVAQSLFKGVLGMDAQNVSIQKQGVGTRITGNGVRAMYVRDTRARAAIWVACQGQEDASLSSSADAVFAMVIGSALRF
jgi:hypothetical protein